MKCLHCGAPLTEIRGAGICEGQIFYSDEQGSHTAERCRLVVAGQRNAWMVRAVSAESIVKKLQGIKPSIPKLDSLSEIAAHYNSVMNSCENFSSGTFTVRLWDGMDGCWCDLNEAIGVNAEIALRVWMERTEGGTRKTNFSGIDYFKIFPANTRMHWDGEMGRELFRSGEDEEERQ